MNDVYLRMLYFDSSAILSWFMEQEGSERVKNIFYQRNGNPLWSLNISSTVKGEIDKKLKVYHQESSPRYNYFQNLLSSFYIVGNLSIDTEVQDKYKIECLIPGQGILKI